MNIEVLGVNHRTAPVTIREKAAIRTEKLYDSMLSLRSYVDQGIILSTCNRTEIYITTNDDTYVEDPSFNFLKTLLEINNTTLPRYMYSLTGREAIEHLFRIAAGLASMIIGEYEILGQVRQALEVAEKAKMVNLPLRRFFQTAIQTGRRVRQETGISRSAVSVSSVAVELAAKILGDLENRKILVIGAGEAGRLVAKAAKCRGASQIVIASRTKERAATLTADLGGIPITMNNVADRITMCDLVITCANAPHWLLDVNQLEVVMRGRSEHPLVIIDVAVPRNVEPAVDKMNNVSLYNIDDLVELSDHNKKQREVEIEKAIEIMAAGVDEFTSWWKTLEVRPVIATLMSMAEEIRRTQLRKTLKTLRPLSDEEQNNLEAMTKSIVSKILKEPINHLKANTNSDSDYVEVVRYLFNLGRENRT